MSKSVLSDMWTNRKMWLIVTIWEREELREAWQLGIICPVCKKGDKWEFGIPLLINALKVFANILCNCVLP